MATSLELAGRLAQVVATQQEVLAALTDVEKVMALVVDRTPEVTSGTGAVIEIVDGDHLVYRAASGVAKEHLGLRLPRATSLSGRAVTEKSLMRSDDVDLDPRVDGAACRAIGIRSMIIAPLLEGDRAVGALKTFSSRANAFEDLDAYALQLLAGMTSGALTQALAYRDKKMSEERYRMLFDRNVAGVFRSTLDGSILDCNDALVQYLGYDSREELLSRSAWDLYHDRNDRNAFLAMVDEKRPAVMVRIPFRRKDGSSLLAVVTAGAFPDEKGETQILGTIVEA